MLSDEEREAVEYFKDDINYLEDALNHPNFLGHFITIRDKEFQMLKILVNLIEKQFKEIEEAEQKEKKAYIDGTNVAHELCNKYWKDKIKAKIEYYKKIDNAVGVRILESLLEKE